MVTYFQDQRVVQLMQNEMKNEKTGFISNQPFVQKLPIQMRESVHQQSVQCARSSKPFIPCLERVLKHHKLNVPYGMIKIEESAVRFASTVRR